MKRREFIVTGSLASMALGLDAMAYSTGIETAGDLQDYLRSIYRVKEPSVDRIIIGDPDTKIKKVGTSWFPYFKTLKKAKDLGINVMVVHEPTFYTHWDLKEERTSYSQAPEPAKKLYTDAVNTKKKWIEENEMVIIRSHDVMDIVKGFGIPFALGQFLGYSNKDIIRSKDYYNVYQIETEKAGTVARRIASHLRTLDQPGVAFYGDPDRLVSNVGLGTGCICDPMQYQELKPDLSIAIDDTVRTWIQTAFAEDTGNPLIVINHGTSEESGMRLLNKHLTDNIPTIEFIHLNQGCGYQWIAGD